MFSHVFTHASHMGGNSPKEYMCVQGGREGPKTSVGPRPYVMEELPW